MFLLSIALGTLLAAEPGQRAALTVQAPDSPVRLDHATVMTPPAGPPVLLYEAVNLTGDALDTFTVIAYVFKQDGTLKARQTAPERLEIFDAGARRRRSRCR